MVGSLDHNVMIQRILLVSAALFSNCWLACAQFAIRDGDRVVFLGDSITEQRLYTTYIEAYALTRHPLWKLSFRNVGWGGDTAWLRQRAHPDEAKLFAAEEDAQQRTVEDSVGKGLSRDVLPLNPTFVTIKFGMNDHSYQKFRPDIFKAYTRSQSQLLKVLSGAGARVSFLTPQPIEDKRPDPDQDIRNQSLRKFSDGLKQVAQEHGAGFVDQFDPYMAVMMAERAKDPKAFIGGGDAVHPGPAGHTIMAWAVLKGLGATAPVSSASITVPSGSANISGCKVDRVAVSDSGVSFDRIDEALPFPVDERAEPALKIAPILEDLSQYELRVSELASGSYEILIDGESVMKTDADALKKGINLSNNAGSITKQSRELLGEVFKKNNVYFRRWREVQLYSFPPWAQGEEIESRRRAELKKLDGEVADSESKIESLRKLVSHHFEIKRVSP